MKIQDWDITKTGIKKGIKKKLETLNLIVKDSLPNLVSYSIATSGPLSPKLIDQCCKLTTIKFYFIQNERHTFLRIITLNLKCY